MPSAVDEAGIRMLDSIREIFDILEFDFELVEFDISEYKKFDDLVIAINNRKCPVVDVMNKYLNPAKQDDSSHVMVATGIKFKNGAECIQLKNSHADDPIEQGKVLLIKIYSET